MKTGIWLAFVLMLLISIPATAQQQEESDIPESPAGMLQFMTIHTDGEKLLQVVRKRIEGAEMVEQEYTVAIPVTRDGVTKMRHETRIRMTWPTKLVMEEIDKAAIFTNLKNEELKRSDVLERIPMTGLKVIFVGNPKAQIAEVWHDLLKDDVIVMKLAPKP